MPADLSNQIFNIDSEYTIINYADENIHFEIFIDSRKNKTNDKRIDHVCLAVNDLEEFIQKCHAVNAEVLQVPKGDKMLTFNRDFDGNLFEIKEK